MRDGLAVRRRGERVGPCVLSYFCDPDELRRIGAVFRGGGVRERARQLVANEREVGELQLGLAGAGGRKLRQAAKVGRRFGELSTLLQQTHQREPGLDASLARPPVGRDGAAGGDRSQRRHRRRRVAQTLLRLRQEHRCLGVVGVSARLVAQAVDLGVELAPPLPTEQRQQTRPRFASQPRSLGERVMRQRQDPAPLDDRVVELALALLDLREQTVGSGVRGVGCFRTLRLLERIVQQLVIEQQLAEAQMPLRR